MQKFLNLISDGGGLTPGNTVVMGNYGEVSGKLNSSIFTALSNNFGWMLGNINNLDNFGLISKYKSNTA